MSTIFNVLKFLIITVFIISNSYSQEINLEWLQQNPLKDRPTEDTLFLKTSFFSVLLNTRDSSAQNYQQVLGRFLWLLAEKPLLFTSNRLDLVIKEFSSINSDFKKLGWLDSFEKITATQTFKRNEYRDREVLTFEQSTLVMNFSEVANPYEAS